MSNKNDNAAEPATRETENHVEVFFYRVPKKNREAIEKSLNKFRPWFQKRGIALEYYRLGDYKMMEGMEGIAKVVSVAEDEDLWMETQHYRDRKHADDTFASMMKDKEIEQLGQEYLGLITQGKNMVAGGFDRLRP